MASEFAQGIRYFSTFTLLNGSVRYGTVRYSALQCSTVQHSTAQHSAVQYSVVQYSIGDVSVAVDPIFNIDSTSKKFLVDC